MGRTLVAAALSVAAVLLGVAPAGAATHVGFPLGPGESAQVAVIAATDGTANNIVVQRDLVDGVEAIRVTDSGDTVAKVQPQDSCTVAPDEHTITCTLPAVSVVFGMTAVTLNGGNDRLNVLGDVRTNAGGGPGNDVIIGSSADDLLNGESGDDRVEGRGGNDQIDLPQAARDLDYGNDTLVGGDGDDFITDSSTGYGDDTIDPGLGRDTVGGGAGTDTLTYANSPQRVEIVVPHPGASAPAGSDVVGVYVENFIGSQGPDAITVPPGNYTVDGRAGNDVLRGNAAVLDGGLGNDRLEGGNGGQWMFGGPGVDTLIANAGNDRLYGEDGDDSLVADAGDDYLDGGAGADEIDGGEGKDGVDYSARSAPLRLSVGGGADGEAGENDTILVGTENITGGSGADVIVGDLGPNHLHGGPGDDELSGDLGADEFVGGDGTDTVSYADHTRSVSVTAGEDNSGDGELDEGDSVAADVEALVGGSGADLLSLEAASVTSGARLAGGSGADTLIGNDSPTTYEGGPAGDSLRVGLGVGVVRGGEGLDTVDFRRHTAPLRIDLAGEVALLETGPVGLESIESAVGGAGDDILASADTPQSNLFGGPGADTITSNAADSLIDGGPGDDSMRPGLGLDIVRGGPGHDRALYDERQQRVRVTVGRTLDADGEPGELDDVTGDVEEVAGGAGNDQLIGGDTLLGNDGDDTLDGAEGNDVLLGGTGRDELYGADGNDRLVGEAGGDNLRGEGGNDVLDATTGEEPAVSDYVACGDGYDGLLAVAGLDTIEPDCESLKTLVTQVDRTILHGARYRPPPRGINLDGRVASLAITCPREATEACAGRVKMKAAQRFKGHRRGTLLGESGFSIAPGARAAIRVKLSQKLSRAISKRLKVTVTVTGPEPVEQTTVLRKKIGAKP